MREEENVSVHESVFADTHRRGFAIDPFGWRGLLFLWLLGSVSSLGVSAEVEPPPGVSAATASSRTGGIVWKMLHSVERTTKGFATTGPDPFLVSEEGTEPVSADRHVLLLEMRTSAAKRVQLFWMAHGEGTVEGRSTFFETRAGSKIETYAVDLAAGGDFGGASSLRIDPGDAAGLEFDIGRIDFVTPSEVPTDLQAGLIRFRAFTSKLHFDPDERIEYRATLVASAYPDRESSKVLTVEILDEHGKLAGRSVEQFGLRPGSVFKEIQGVLEPCERLRPGIHTLTAVSVDQRTGLRLTSEHVFGVRGPSDPLLLETPFKFLKDFSIVRGPLGRWHVFSITGDFFDNHDWMPDGQERTFSHSSSEDLVHWTMHPPVISVSSKPYPDGRGCFQDRNVWAPHVIAHAGRYWMFYTSVNRHVSQSISLATSTDLFEWVEHPGNPVFTPEGVDGIRWGRDQWADCRDPMVLEDHGRFYLYATVNATPPGESGGVVVVESTDLVHWENPRLAVRGRVVSESPQVVRLGNRYFMTTSSIGAATYASGHPAEGWMPFAFPRPDIASVEFHVATSPSYAEETVALSDGGLLVASLTWRHWGNSIYFFRLRAEAGVPVGYEKPVLPVKPPAIGNRQ